MPNPKTRTQTITEIPATSHGAKPLEPDEIERARVIGTRLGQEITQLLKQIPRTGASSLSLSRDLNINRHICHRVFSALEFEHDWLELLLRMPGVPSLRTLAHAAAGGKKSKRTNDVTAAIDQFERFIWSTGGSQRQFNARLSQTRSLIAVHNEHAPAESTQPHASAGLFHAASQIMGACADTMIWLWIMRPSATPGMLERVAVNGSLGLRTRNASFPLMPVVTSFSVLPGEKGLVAKMNGVQVDSEDDANAIPGLMREFSSRHLPPITTRSMPGGVMRVIDAPITNEDGIDLVMRTHMSGPDPRQDAEPYQVISRRIRTPTRRLIIDTFFHRSIRVKGVIRPSAVHPQWNTMSSPHTPWHESLPGEFRVEHLGAGTEMTRTPCWTRYQDLCNAAFQASGWDPDEFIGWRCHTDFPYWGATYLVSFELER